MRRDPPVGRQRSLAPELVSPCCGLRCNLELVRAGVNDVGWALLSCSVSGRQSAHRSRPLTALRTVSKSIDLSIAAAFSARAHLQPYSTDRAQTSGVRLDDAGTLDSSLCGSVRGTSSR